MSPDDVQKTCTKYELPIVARKINNVQAIIQFLNMEEKRLAAEEAEESLKQKTDAEAEIKKEEVKPKQKKHSKENEMSETLK